MTHDFGWYRNISFWSGFVAFLVAQTIKLLAHYRRTRKIDLRFMVSLGGMPSSHSALVSALATSVGLQAGFSTALFATAFALAIIVMSDAQGVRRAAGQQARLLNQIVEELFQEHHLSKQKLQELLGHTRLEVLAGMLLGIFVAFLTKRAR